MDGVSFTRVYRLPRRHPTQVPAKISRCCAPASRLRGRQIVFIKESYFLFGRPGPRRPLAHLFFSSPTGTDILLSSLQSTEVSPPPSRPPELLCCLAHVPRALYESQTSNFILLYFAHRVSGHVPMAKKAGTHACMYPRCMNAFSYFIVNYYVRTLGSRLVRCNIWCVRV